MAYSFPPTPDGPADPTGDVQHIPQLASRSTRRLLQPGVLARILVLAVTLALLVGVFALVHTNNGTSAPARSVATTGAIASAYNVQTLETTIVIDPHGRVAYRSDGAVPPDQLAQIVRKLA